jgi:hypothetical protein
MILDTPGAKPPCKRSLVDLRDSLLLYSLLKKRASGLELAAKKYMVYKRFP